MTRKLALTYTTIFLKSWVRNRAIFARHTGSLIYCQELKQIRISHIESSTDSNSVCVIQPSATSPLFFDNLHFEHFDKSVNLDSWLTLLSKCSKWRLSKKRGLVADGWCDTPLVILWSIVCFPNEDFGPSKICGVRAFVSTFLHF
jgi:hypothetical protein